MKNHQKGFATILVVMLIVATGVIGYLIFDKFKPLPTNEVTSTTSTSNETQQTQSAETPISPPAENQSSNKTTVENKTETKITKSKYCLSGQCWEDNSSSIFRELFGEKLNAVASNDPSIYKGTSVSGLYFDDEWFTTCEPLKQKVNELISGKSTSREKILAIANWVASSRPYGFIPAGEALTICELYSAKSGVCSNAANLTTAMLRFAGIPARVIDPKTDGKTVAHEYTAAFLDNKWIAIDSTFGGGVREIFEPTAALSSIVYYAFDKPKEIIIPAFNNPYNIEFTYYLADGIFSLVHTESDLITENGTSKIESYGTITYVKPRYFSQDIGYIGNATLIAKNLQCDYYECKKLSGTESKILLPQEYIVIKAKKMIHVVDGKVAQQIDNEFATNADLRKDYYVVTTYPAGRYRFVYESSTSGKVVAYYDFELQQSGNVVITPDKLIKEDGVSSTEFNNFVNYLRGVK